VSNLKPDTKKIWRVFWILSTAFVHLLIAIPIAIVGLVPWLIYEQHRKLVQWEIDRLGKLIEEEE
jgi:hypothetical protein